MDVLIESAIMAVMCFIGSGIILFTLKSFFGKSITYKLCLWLIPGIIFVIVNTYFLGRMGGINNIIVTLITMPLGVSVLLVSLVYIGKKLSGSLQRIADELNDSSKQIHLASSQIAASSQHIAEGVSSQAAAIEETSSSMEEMSSMTKGNADNAHLAKVLMAETMTIVN